MSISKLIKSKTYKCLNVVMAALYIQAFLLTDLTSAMSAASSASTSGSSSSGAFKASQGPPAPMELFQVDTFTGAFTTGVPIFTPPGRKGIEPKITLSYNSSGPNSWLGVGWGLGFGSISRSTKKGVPKYDERDTYILSFQGVSSELVSIEANEYRTKDEALFLKITYVDPHWVVTDKSGTKYWFGQDSAARQESPLGTFAWMFHRVEDTNGNYMEIDYVKDEGAVYPLQIRYTGNSNVNHLPLHTVDFILEDRSDRTIAYNSGAKIAIRKRLKQVDVSVNGQLARRYVLDYIYSKFTKRSCLAKVTEIGSDGVTSLPPVTFMYQSVGLSFEESREWYNIENLDNDNFNHIHFSKVENSKTSFTKISILDINGDGLSDRILQDDGSSTNWKVQLNTGVDFQDFINWHNVAPIRGSWIRRDKLDIIGSSVRSSTIVDIVDINGDGFPDRVIDNEDFSWTIQFNNGESFDDPVIWTGMAGTKGNGTIRWVTEGRNNDERATQIDLIDINGDSLPDRIITEHSSEDYWLVQFNTGNGFQSDKSWRGVENSDDVAGWIRMSAQNGRSVVDLFDINGDGLPDRVFKSMDKSWKVQFNNGTGFEPSVVWDDEIEDLGKDERRYISYAREEGSNSSVTEVDIMDINGDGISDRLIQNEAHSDHWKIQLNSGSDYCPSTDWTNVRQIPNAWIKSSASKIENQDRHQKVKTDLFDLNGDGLLDRVIVDREKWKVQLCRGEARDLMIGMDNGRGGTSKIEYASSNQYDNTGDDDISDLPFPVVTVSRVTTADGLGNSYTTRYEYEQGLFDADDSEFRGFGHVTILDPTFIARHFWHHQDDIKKGKVYLEELRSAGGALYSKTESTWDVGHPHERVNFVFAKETVNHIFDGDDTSKQIKTQFEYDEYGNLSKSIEHGDIGVTGDERTTVNEFAYNLDRYILNALSKTTLYDAENTKCSEKLYYYDGAASSETPPTRGNLTKEEEWLNTGPNPSTQMTYDDFGNILSITDANGNVTKNTYDQTFHKFLVTIENALGHTTGFEYEPRYAQILSTTDSNGVVERSIYDVFGRLIKSIGPNDTEALPTQEIIYDLDILPNRITTKLRVEHGETEVMTSYAFIDGMGRTIQTRSPAEDSEKQIVTGVQKFNNRGQVEMECHPYFDDFSEVYVQPSENIPCVTYKYDEIARITQTIYADGTSSSIAYDDLVTTETDPNGHPKRSAVDAYGRTILIEEYNKGETYRTHYRYDCLGNLTKTIDDHRNETVFIYDSLSRKIQMVDPDMGTWSYAYDDNGNLISQTDALNNTIKFDYDALNRITLKDYPEGQQDVVYTYDSGTVVEWGAGPLAGNFCIGKLTRIIDGSGSTEMAYDNQGRTNKLRKTVDPYSYDFITEFDALGRKKTVSIDNGSDPQESTQYTYNNQGEIESIISSVDGPIVTNVDYNASSQMTRVDYGNGTFTDYSYDPETFRLTQLQTKNNANKALQNLSYQFDNVGNVKRIQDTINTATQTFQYDDLNRLRYAAGSSYGVKTYEYDSIGNMLKKGALAMNYGDDAGPHAVTSASDGRTFEYDANGSMIKRGEDILHYDFDQKLTRIDVKKADPESVTYDLKPGWNWISFPALPHDKSIENVLKSIWDHFDQISKYDPTKDEWFHFVKEAEFSEFEELEYGVGYQIYITKPLIETLVVKGQDIPGNQTIKLKPGDNLIGPSIDEELDVGTLYGGISFIEIKKWDSENQKIQKYPDGDFTSISPGEAFFVTVTGAEVLTLDKPSKTVRFVYDGNGLRTKKITESSVTHYIGENIAIDKTGLVKKHISLNGTKVFTSESDGDKFFTHTDHINSSNISTDINGNKISLIEYSPYGQTSRLEGDIAIAHKFTGYEEDNETDLYYARARYYDPELGRFSTADSLRQDPSNPQTFNRYSYSNNNPVSYIDPSGHGFFSNFINLAIGTFIGAFFGPAGSIFQAVFFGTIGGAISGAVSGLIESGLKGSLNGGLYGALTGAIGGAIGYALRPPGNVADEAVQNASANNPVKKSISGGAAKGNLTPNASNPINSLDSRLTVEAIFANSEKIVGVHIEETKTSLIVKVITESTTTPSAVTNKLDKVLRRSLSDRLSQGLLGVGKGLLGIVAVAALATAGPVTAIPLFIAGTWGIVDGIVSGLDAFAPVRTLEDDALLSQVIEQTTGSSMAGELVNIALPSGIPDRIKVLDYIKTILDTYGLGDAIEDDMTGIYRIVPQN